MIDFILHLLVKPVLAAADPELVNASNNLVNSVKENVTGAALSPGTIAVLGTIFGIMLVFVVVPRLLRRFAK